MENDKKSVDLAFGHTHVHIVSEHHKTTSQCWPSSLKCSKILNAISEREKEREDMAGEQRKWRRSESSHMRCYDGLSKVMLVNLK